MSAQHIEARRLREVAREALKEGHLQEALTYARQAAALEPDGEETHVLLGIVLCQNGMTTEGIDALRTAVTLKPRNTTTRANLATAYQRAGRWDLAAAEWQEILREEPANSRAQAALFAAEQKLAESGGHAASSSCAAPTMGAAHEDGWDPLQPSGRPSAPQPSPAAQPQQFGYGQPQPSPAAQPQQFGYGGPPPPAQAYPPGVVPQPGGPYAPPPPPPPGVYTPGYGGPPPPVGFQYAAPVGEDTGGWSIENIVGIIASPVSFMASQRGQMGLGKPTGFYVINLLIASALGLVIGLISLAGAAGRSSASGAVALGVGAGTGVMVMVCGLVIIIPIALGLMLLGAAIVHLFVMMVRGQGSYGATFRACVYATVPSTVATLVAHLLMLVPGAIWMFWPAMALQWGGRIWAVIVLVIALRELHTLSTGAAAFAGVVPIVVGTLLSVALVMVLLMPMMSKYSGTPYWWTMLGPGFPSRSSTRSSPGTTSSPGATTTPGAPGSGSFRGPYMGPSGP